MKFCTLTESDVKVIKKKLFLPMAITIKLTAILNCVPPLFPSFDALIHYFSVPT